MAKVSGKDSKSTMKKEIAVFKKAKKPALVKHEKMEYKAKYGKMPNGKKK